MSEESKQEGSQSEANVTQQDRPANTMRHQYAIKKGQEWEREWEEEAARETAKMDKIGTSGKAQTSC